MIDIVSVGNDIGLANTNTERAGNILSIQLGSLEYLPLFGIDLAYFLSEDFRFQNESFRSYLIETLANNGINVSSVTELVDNLFTQLNIEVSADESTTALMAR